MKKNVLIKGILVLVVIAVLAIGFTGCCTIRIVNITTPNDSYWYNIYIDGVLWGTTNSTGNMTLSDVPLGYHVFYAVSTDYLYDGYEYPIIVCGINNVSIYTD